MATYTPIFDRVKKLLQGGPGYATAKAVKWLETTIGTVTTSPAQILKDTTRITPDVFIGKMFMFLYDPKLKKTLPYYDKFPLIIPIEIYDDGFLGLNLHYLPPRYRVALLDKLLEYTNNDKMDKSTKLKVTYSMLKHVAKAQEIQACIKRYLASHVASQFISIDAPDWEIAVFLPVERFAKADKETVWAKSISHIKKNYTRTIKGK